METGPRPHSTCELCIPNSDLESLGRRTFYLIVVDRTHKNKIKNFQFTLRTHTLINVRLINVYKALTNASRDREEN